MNCISQLAQRKSAKLDNIVTLFEAQIWDSLYGCISLLHVIVEILKELFLCFWGPPCQTIGPLLLDFSVCHIHVCLTVLTEKSVSQLRRHWTFRWIKKKPSSSPFECSKFVWCTAQADKHTSKPETLVTMHALFRSHNFWSIIVKHF